MRLSFNRIAIFCAISIILLPTITFADDAKAKGKRKGQFYFSWGYNQEWYTNSTVSVSQPALGNNYNLVSVKGHDRPGWDGEFFEKALTIPQYNYRFGYFFNKNKDLGIELNFDHTKYIIIDQQMRVAGKINGQPVDYNINFSAANGFYYFLNNGANFFLFNLVKRYTVINRKKEDPNFKVDLIGKAGVGPVVPHVQNSFFNEPNTPHFQLGGWNTGVEAGVKAIVYKYVYLEYTNKVDYARYSGLKIYDGTAKQSFGTYEMILSLGITFPMGKRLVTDESQPAGK